jgi:glycosyltransferase involved in cell wall biosynthesis
VLEGADRIITVSSKLKDIVKDRPFANKTEVISNGISPEDCAPFPARPAAAARPGAGPKILSVSNLKKTKGIDINIRAVAQLAGRYPQLTYLIVGDGEERQNLENLAGELNLQERVTFLGRLDHPEVMKTMAEADIFCLPSWQEGFGIVYIEAMAQGLPVIAVRGEGIEDVIVHEHNGLLVKPRSAEEVAEALDLLLKNPEKASCLAEAGRKTVLNGFTWRHNAERTARVYREVIS